MSENKWPIALFNGTVVTTNGIYEVSDVEVEEARELIHTYGFESAIGHEATAELMSELLRQPIRMKRIQYHQEVGQIAIVFKLNIRPDEGVILDKAEVEHIGYCLKKMIRLK